MSCVFPVPRWWQGKGSGLGSALGQHVLWVQPCCWGTAPAPSTGGRQAGGGICLSVGRWWVAGGAGGRHGAGGRQHLPGNVPPPPPPHPPGICTHLTMPEW